MKTEKLTATDFFKDIYYKGKVKREFYLTDIKRGSEKIVDLVVRMVFNQITMQDHNPTIIMFENTGTDEYIQLVDIKEIKRIEKNENISYEMTIGYDQDTRTYCFKCL